LSEVCVCLFFTVYDFFTVFGPMTIMTSRHTYIFITGGNIAHLKQWGSPRTHCFHLDVCMQSISLRNLSRCRCRDHCIYKNKTKQKPSSAVIFSWMDGLTYRGRSMAQTV